MPQPTLGDVHVNGPLTRLTQAFQQDASDFISDKVFPSIPVPHRSDSYYVYNRGDFFRNNMQKRAPGTPAVAGGYKLATKTYIADVWAIKKIIDDQIRANSDSILQPDRDATLWLTQQAMVNRDVNWAATYFKAGVWGNTDQVGVTGTPSTNQFKRWDAAGSTPLEDILTQCLVMKGQTGMWPNTLVLGPETYIKLLTNAQIVDRLKYGQTPGGPVTIESSDLQALFKIKRVLVMSGIQTTSPENMYNDSRTLPDTFAFIAGKGALLTYSSESPGMFSASAGYTFNWTGLTGSTPNGYRIKKFRWEIDAADHLEIESAYAFGIVAPEMGTFFGDVVS